MSELVITIVRVAVDDLKEKTERERPIWERIKTAIAWLVPPARTTQPHCVAGIGRASEAQDLPTARDQGRIPDAHHSAVPRHGDTRLWGHQGQGSPGNLNRSTEKDRSFGRWNCCSFACM